MDFERVREIFGRRGKESEVSEYEASYNELIKRIEHSFKAQPQGDWGDPKRIRQYALALRQILLHRGLKLFLGSLHALLENNAYSMILSIERGAKGTLMKMMKIITLHPLVIVVERICASASEIRRTWDTSPCDGRGN